MEKKGSIKDCGYYLTLAHINIICINWK